MRSTKRRRESMPWAAGSIPKFPATTSIRASRGSPERKLGSNGRVSGPSAQVTQSRSFDREESPTSPVFASEDTVVPGLRYTDLREVLQYVINDSLKVGGRPESATAQENEGGAIIEVKTKSPSGEEYVKNIEWMVDQGVPETILSRWSPVIYRRLATNSIIVDEKDLAKTISCIVLNAVKFTDVGTITLRAKLSQNSRYIVITVKDTGPGIPSAFLPYLFKPFSREDVSLSRQTEGLGLGLMVAKGLARKLGGDLYCLRSDVSGPEKGSEFEMRVPLRPGEICSRPGTPYGSPTIRSRTSVDSGVAQSDVTRPPTPPITSEQSKQRETPSTPPTMVEPLPHLHIPPPLPQSESPRKLNGNPTPYKGVVRSTTAFDRNLSAKYPLTFLVVEDNRINRNLLVAMLKKLGYTAISQAYDGQDAVNQMKTVQHHGKEIDVVLMDLWMPLMDGYQAAEEILRMGKTPIILAVTADATHSALERAAKVGMRGSLSKPFMIHDLEKLITKYCAHRRVA
jgi:CheY-like chemotaxis protein